MCRIVAKEFITKDVVKLTFESKNIAQLALPGQFVNISTSDDTMLLKRPISICEIKGNNIIVCFKIIGKGTKKISEKKVNDTIEVIGPLGNGFPLIKKRKLLLIGGGCGIFPLLEVAKRAYKENVLQIILAARNQDELYLQEEFKKYGNYFEIRDDIISFSLKTKDILQNKDVFLHLLDLTEYGILRYLDDFKNI